MKRAIPIFIIVCLVFVFFWQFLLRGFLPIPSDTIVGLYHPFRDLYAKDYPNGIPFKNYLITDPVRQIYPWKNLATNIEKNRELPLWNPYSFSGSPLLANLQSAVFYPLNVLFFLLPFSLGWGVFVLLQPFLAGIFLYFYLRNINLDKFSSLAGSLVFSFSGVSIAWLEWGTVLHVALWLPLIFLSIDKIFYYLFTSPYSSKMQFKSKNYLLWSIVFMIALASAFLAGHLQVFFYLYLVSFFYFFARFLQFGQSKKVLFVFLILNLIFIILTSIQWISTLQFILLSARNVDQSALTNPGWFIPWQNLIQFLVPDFFGNPATLNYWGIWNYGEFIGYIGILPLIFAFYALFFRHDKKTLFFGSVFFLSLLFALPTFIAKLPYVLNVPFVSTAQPTRLLVLTDFSLAILFSLGFDFFLKKMNKKIIYSLLFIGLVFIALWIFIFVGIKTAKGLDLTHLEVAKKNLYLPTAIFITSLVIILFSLKLISKQKLTIVVRIIITALVVFDLFRFGWKFTPFLKPQYIFPDTKSLSYLEEQKGEFRIMTTDSRILPPNFSLMYNLQDISGYDPLYLKRYAELIVASQRHKPDISPPFGFNRIIDPHTLNSNIINLLGVKYILSLSDLKSNNLIKVFQEGQTRVYENKSALPRTFFVKRLENALTKQDAIDKMFSSSFNPAQTAVVEKINNNNFNKFVCDRCFVEILSYNPDRIVLETNGGSNGFLVLTDTFYPTWHAAVDNKEIKIYRTDFNFRGIFVPRGQHSIMFYDTLF